MLLYKNIILEIGNRTKMKEIQLENLSSLKYLRLDFQSIEKVTLRNLLTLRESRKTNQFRDSR